MIPCFVCGTVLENRGHDRADDCSCGLLWANRESGATAVYFGNNSLAQLQAPRGDTEPPIVRFTYRSLDEHVNGLTFDNFWDLANEVVTYWTLQS